MRLFLILLSIPALLVVLFILFFIVASVVSKDIESLDHGDMYLSVDEIVVPRTNDNAYYVFDFAQQGSSDLLSQLRKAVKRPKFFCPNYEQGFYFKTSVCEVNKIRQMGRVAQESALAKAEKGDIAGALEDAMLPIQLGAMIQAAPGRYIDYLVGLSMKNEGFYTIKTIALKQPIPEDIATIYRTKLEKHKSDGEDLKRVFRVDYTEQYNSDPFRGKIVSNYYVQPNRYYKELAENKHRYFALADASCTEVETMSRPIEIQFQENYISYRNTLIFLPFTQNAVYKVLGNSMAASMTSIFTKTCEVETERIEAIASLKFSQ